MKRLQSTEARIEAASGVANSLSSAILAKAFSGELVPTEAELARREGRSYKPAFVLLERIRAEREQAQIKPKGRTRATVTSASRGARSPRG